MIGYVAMPCCNEFERAQVSGTDNEAYGRLIRLEHDGSYTTGCDLPAIRFCPWCGVDKTKKHPLELAAQKVVDSVFGPCRRDWDDLKDAIAELGSVLDSAR